jgi:RNA polymerase sigma factor for flagellar operon FliA
MDKNNQVKQMWKKYNKTKSIEDKNVIVEYYYKYVKNIANKIAKKINNKVLPDELASYGLDGLYDAIAKFKTRRKIKFETYAYTRIFGSIIDQLRYNDWVPRSVHLRQSLMDSVRHEIESEMGSKVPDLDVLDRLGIDETEYHKNHKKFFATNISSIETSICPDVDQDSNKKDFNRFLEAKNIVIPGSQMIRKEFFTKLLNNDFSPKERKLVYYYYYDGMTIRQISKKLKVSESRLSQIRQKIMKKLQVRIGEDPQYFEDGIATMVAHYNDKDSLY